MPTVNVDTTVDVNVKEMLDNCNDEEIQQVIQWLKAYEFINNSDLESRTFPHQQFHNSVTAIVNNYYLLTPEEQSTVETIANKYC
jgi:hypothetical protein